MPARELLTRRKQHRALAVRTARAPHLRGGVLRHGDIERDVWPGAGDAQREPLDEHGCRGAVECPDPADVGAPGSDGRSPSSDRFGGAPPATGGLALMGVLEVRLAAWAPDAVVLGLSRIVTGIGGASFGPAGYAFVADAITPLDVPRRLAYSLTASRQPPLSVCRRSRSSRVGAISTAPLRRSACSRLWWCGHVACLSGVTEMAG